MGDSLFVIDSTFLLEASHNTFHGAPLLQDSSGRSSVRKTPSRSRALSPRKWLISRQPILPWERSFY